MLLSVYKKWQSFPWQQIIKGKLRNLEDQEAREKWLDTVEEYRDLFQYSHWIIPMNSRTTETLSIPVNNLEYYLYLEGRSATYKGFTPPKDQIKIPSATAFFQIFRKLDATKYEELFLLPAVLFILHYQVPLPDNLNDIEVAQVRNLAARIERARTDIGSD
jgi:hypothetical protein